MAFQTNTNVWKPALGDRYLRDWILGGNGAAAKWDYKIMAGCALTGVATPTLTIASGRAKAGGILADYNGGALATPNKSVTEHLMYEITLTKNSAGKVTGYSQQFKLNSTAAPSSALIDFYFKVAEVAIGAANITSIDIGEDNDWYAFPHVKLGSGGWIASDPANPTSISAASGSVTAVGAGNDISKDFDIEPGMKATLVYLWAATAVPVLRVYSKNEMNGILSALDAGGGNPNTVIDITDFTFEGIDVIRVLVDAVNSVAVYGGKIKLELVAA